MGATINNESTITEQPPKLVSEYDQEISQSHTTNKPMAPQGREAQQILRQHKDKINKSTARFSPSIWLQN